MAPLPSERRSFYFLIDVLPLLSTWNKTRGGHAGGPEESLVPWRLFRNNQCFGERTEISPDRDFLRHGACRCGAGVGDVSPERVVGEAVNFLPKR